MDSFFATEVGAASMVYSTLGLRYSQVCGQVQAYQFSSPDGFVRFIEHNERTINSAYFDGVRIHNLW